MVPNNLQMGWTESSPPPPFFVATETVRGIIQHLLQTELPSRPFEQCMLPVKGIATQATAQDIKTNLELVEFFVDDFIGVTNNTSKEHLIKFSRAMLHSIHKIFPSPAITGHSGGTQSQRKN